MDVPEYDSEEQDGETLIDSRVKRDEPSEGDNGEHARTNGFC